MNIKKLMKFGNVVSYASIILVPIIWLSFKYFDILLVNFIWATLYTWLYIISWYAVVFVMIIRPLADIFPKYKILRQLCLLRRAFGILSSVIIVTFLLDKWIGSPSSFFAFFTLSDWQWWYPLVARLSEITALTLLLTSNNFSQKKLKKNWKRIQRTSYIYFITGGILAMRYGDTYWVQISMTIMALLFIAAVTIKYWRNIKKK